MPAFRTPSGALPARFRRPRVLIVGCGDVGQRAATRLAPARVYALTSTPERLPALRALGITPLIGNLDDAASLKRLQNLAPRVLHLAPPEANGSLWDHRTRNLLSVLYGAGRVLVYGSTSGVYGDCAGEWVDETRALNPQTPRARLRVDAEARVRAWGRGAGRRANGAARRASILRIPGIYANDRAGGTPRARLARGTPVLRPEDDVYTNHVHADDLARACVLALWRARAQRVYNVNDDSQLRMGDYFDLAADLYGLARPPRLTREQAQQALTPMTLSFMSESRRMDNGRLCRELRLHLLHPTVDSGLRA